MARIIRPQEQTVLNRGQISPSAGARAAESGAAIGQVEQQLGQQIASAGNQMLEATKASLQSSVLTKSLSEAQLELNQKIQERMQQTTDENGNPTYTTLVDDIGQIGNSIREQYSKKLLDPAVFGQFNKQFGHQVSNQQLLGLSKMRNQQLSFGQAALTQALQNTVDSATFDDPANVNQYLTDADTYIRSALQSGTISPQQAQQMTRNVHGEITMYQIRSQMEQDPKAVIASLQEDNPNLTASQQLSLIRQAESKVEDLARRERAEVAEEIRRKKELTDIAAIELTTQIKQGKIGAAEIESAFPVESLDLDTDLGRYQRKKRSQLMATLASQEKKVGTIAKISSAMANGQSLYHFSGSQISKHFQHVIENSGEDGQPLPFFDGQRPSKVLTGATYPVDVPLLRKEIVGKLTDGDPNEALQAIQAIEYLKEHNPAIVRNMNKQEMAIAATAQRYITMSNLSPQQSIERARKQILEQDPVLKAENSRKFRSEKAFSDKRLVSTIEDDFDVGGFIIDGATKSQLKQIYRDNYELVGDAETAREMTKAQVQGLYGKSEFNQKSGLFNDQEKFMKLPPELFNDDVDALKEDLRMAVVTDLPEGVTMDDVIVDSDFLTTTSNPNYAISYIDKFGVKQPLMDGTGQVIRWKVSPPEVETETVDIDALSEEAKQEAIRNNQVGSQFLGPLSEGARREQKRLDEQEVQQDIMLGADPNDLGDNEEKGGDVPSEDTISSEPQAGVFDKMNDRLAAFTRKNLNTKYGFGSKSLKAGKIDCSGWVHKAVTDMAQNLPGTNPKAISQMLNTYAAQQIKNVAKKTGKITSNPSSYAPGMLIGITRNRVPGWARGRYRGISHIGVVVEKEGRLMVSHSGGSTDGVGFVPLESFISSGVSKVHVVDPFYNARKK